MSLAFPSNFANVVAPFVPVGRQPVGLEAEDLRGSTLKPLEQLAETARRENRRSPEDKPNETAERLRLARQPQREGSRTAVAHREGPDGSERRESQHLPATQSGTMSLYRQWSDDAEGDSRSVGSRLDQHV